MPPTLASAGLALMPSIVGQTFSVPETMTLPVRGRLVAGQRTATVDGLAGRDVERRRAAAVDRRRRWSSAVIVIWKPVPAGSPPMVAVSVFDADTLIVPLLVKPFGPVML